MSKSTQNDFRVIFAKMADHAIVTRPEFAELLRTSPGALSQMGYRGELPPTAFPSKRRACWFAKDIRRWLEEKAGSRGLSTESGGEATSTSVSTERRIGRPRKSTD